MTRDEARNHLAEWLDEKMWRCFGTIDREAISIAVEVLGVCGKSPLSPDAFAAEMREISCNNDTEMAHIYADQVMCDLLRSLGYEEGAAIFEDMGKWYS